MWYDYYSLPSSYIIYIRIGKDAVLKKKNRKRWKELPKLVLINRLLAIVTYHCSMQDQCADECISEKSNKVYMKYWRKELGCMQHATLIYFRLSFIHPPPPTTMHPCILLRLQKMAVPQKI